jgi:hypothetical protein
MTPTTTTTSKPTTNTSLSHQYDREHRHEHDHEDRTMSQGRRTKGPHLGITIVGCGPAFGRPEAARGAAGCGGPLPNKINYVRRCIAWS